MAWKPLPYASSTPLVLLALAPFTPAPDAARERLE
jgi:hypothetical protein